MPRTALGIGEALSVWERTVCLFFLFQSVHLCIVCGYFCATTEFECCDRCNYLTKWNVYFLQNLWTLVLSPSNQENTLWPSILLGIFILWIKVSLYHRIILLSYILIFACSTYSSVGLLIGTLILFIWKELSLFFLKEYFR